MLLGRSRCSDEGTERDALSHAVPLGVKEMEKKKKHVR